MEIKQRICSMSVSDDRVNYQSCSICSLKFWFSSMKDGKNKNILNIFYAFLSFIYIYIFFFFFFSIDIGINIYVYVYICVCVLLVYSLICLWQFVCISVYKCLYMILYIQTVSISSYWCTLPNCLYLLNYVCLSIKSLFNLPVISDHPLEVP